MALRDPKDARSNLGHGGVFERQQFIGPPEWNADDFFRRWQLAALVFAVERSKRHIEERRRFLSAFQIAEGDAVAVNGSHSASKQGCQLLASYLTVNRYLSSFVSRESFPG